MKGTVDGRTEAQCLLRAAPRVMEEEEMKEQTVPHKQKVKTAKTYRRPFPQHVPGAQVTVSGLVLTANLQLSIFLSPRC